MYFCAVVSYVDFGVTNCSSFISWYCYCCCFSWCLIITLANPCHIHSLTAFVQYFKNFQLLMTFEHGFYMYLIYNCYSCIDRYYIFSSTQVDFDHAVFLVRWNSKRCSVLCVCVCVCVHVHACVCTHVSMHSVLCGRN